MSANPDLTIPRRFRLSGGIVGREVRAAVPLVLTLAVVPYMLAVLFDRASTVDRPYNGVTSVEAVRVFWVIVSIMTAFLLGALCGAEEEENGTLEFVLVQPIDPLRMLTEKIVGAGLAFLLWAVVSLLLCVLAAWPAAGGLSQAFPPSARDLALLVPRWLPAFFVPLGLGVWVRKVMLTGIVSAAFFMFVLLPLAAASAPKGTSGLEFPSRNVSPLLLVFAALGLASAVQRYMNHGMSWASAGDDADAAREGRTARS